MYILDVQVQFPTSHLADPISMVVDLVPPDFNPLPTTPPLLTVEMDTSGPSDLYFHIAL